MRGTTLNELIRIKDVGVIMSTDLKCSQQCLYVYNKASEVLEMIRRTIKCKKLRIMLSLYKTLAI